MENIEIKCADIFREMQSGKRYRVLSIYDDRIVLCEMDTSKLRITEHQIASLLSLITDKAIVCKNRK